MPDLSLAIIKPVKNEWHAHFYYPAMEIGLYKKRLAPLPRPRKKEKL